MGLLFNLASTNIIAYLTSLKEEPPRISLDVLSGFLQSVAWAPDARLISSDPQWVTEMQKMALGALEDLDKDPRLGGRDHAVDPITLHRVLEPLAGALGRYDLYIMPVGTWRDADVLNRFAHTAARLPGHGILVLIPDMYQQSNLRIFDPNDGAAAALRRQSEWPGAVFLLRNGESAFAPLDQAYDDLETLFELFEANKYEDVRMERASEVLRRQQTYAQHAARILHLSDLHLGTKETEARKVLLRASLQREISSIDQIVITGDLFDQPRRRHARSFKDFRDNIQLQAGQAPIVVPGNHDQKIFGNSLLGIGRRLRQLADLEWRSLVEDAEMRLLFLCFDSSRTRNFARGEVTSDQLVKVATDYEVANAGGRYDEYLKVAVLHHHPYPWGSQGEPSLLDGIVKPENFVEMVEGRVFMEWCAGRGVSLVLHGHKHVPRLIHDRINVGDRDSELTTVACGTSLGANGRPLSYNIVDWNPDSQAWSIDFKVDRGDGQGFRSVLVETHSAA